ncbi:MAG: phosphate ABC transporter, permease protein PstA [Rhizobiales bacterium 24-66-13]|jgi:phosphate transport system permease protein|uniref:phosphate ABC transporter permease PstA n=1 Tax=Roseixanthobacter finlandensis TaxID=3119922 RepID=UPI000BD2D75D|nr:MAG: phosphate ABC transporter, permease protein PstA [Rhizobiales bacterium 12-66-7]OYY84523.1 MAG: phosphate ABC transporter, permease protein PstA [Rhizobiales bacterium 35-66-30]OYZ77600.1 MAG: phosphate ABC transporter, permease protein PstA [Rhizobiales bacterium 24-66-13]OZB07143.1 MAG: phosphate ABC transporter, permease protein PstA [Rhizobiales bacterium 39-66-18]HQS48926.1 phosphate ABC transporter permease PstA [Xanthobacteraceae bacterium]
MSLAIRRTKDHVVKAVSTAFAGIALFLLAWILFTLVQKGLPALGLNVFTKITLPPGHNGGLLNAIVGSLIQIGIAMVIGTPIGLLAGTFLAENGKTTKVGHIARFVNDILLSAPSILVGLFVYAFLVNPFGGFSGWAGSAALAILVIPVIVRTTEDMLNLVPIGLREAAYALGAPQWKVVMMVTWRAARAGIMTGVLLSIARAAGETAPLLFTSLGNNSWSTDLSAPMASLPIAIYQYAGSPFDDWVALAWAGALLITVSVLLLNIVSRLFLARAG